jgi:hypothetical protein
MLKSPPTARFDRRAPIVALALATALALAGCGGSGQKSANDSIPKAVIKAAKKLGISPNAIDTADRAGVEALASCLREHGVKVPPQNLSVPHPSFSTKGINKKSAQFHSCLDAATAEYRSQLARQSPAAKVPPKLQAAAARVGVITATRCMHKHGVRLPPQNLSAKNPVFNTNGLDTKNPRIAAALHVCLHTAIAAYEARLHQR